MSTPSRRKALGDAMRYARKAKGMTQRQVAMALIGLGDDVTEQAVSGYERGEYAPEVDRIRLLEQVLEVDLIHHVTSSLGGLTATATGTVSPGWQAAVDSLTRRMEGYEDGQAELTALVQELIGRLESVLPAAPPSGRGARPRRPA